MQMSSEFSFVGLRLTHHTCILQFTPTYSIPPRPLPSPLRGPSPAALSCPLTSDHLHGGAGAALLAPRRHIHGHAVGALVHQLVQPQTVAVDGGHLWLQRDQQVLPAALCAQAGLEGGQIWPLDGLALRGQVSRIHEQKKL